ncbi:MAG TPA: glycosyltransferase family 9 protein [Parvularculaceae bacterium]|nr:glycosyltransferase family 9 protein [Parvularculaceae bacterium]HNS86676.1 glycosyltransferase family 9 protein [Parvularculaceae bacterium]
MGRHQNILVIKTDGLAAFVAAEPLYEAVRAAHPGARISLLTQSHLQRIARASPYFDQVAAMPDFRDPEAKKAFVQQVKSSGFSYIYDLAANEDAKKLYSALGLFRPKWRSVAPASRSARKKGAPEEGLPDMTKFSNAVGVSASERLPDFRWALATRKDSANMQPSWFGISGVFGLLMPGVDETRRWPSSRYADLARMMAKKGVMPVLVGPKELHAFADDVAHAAPELVDLTGKADHLQLVSLAQAAAFFVSDAAEEVHLVVSVGCAGVLIRKAGEEHLSPKGRNVITLTTRSAMDEASPEFVWRALENMGLIPKGSANPRAAVR